VRVLAPLAMSAESVALKIELKSWETQFQNTYGRKPTPDDIRGAGLGPFKLVVLRFVNDFDWDLQPTSTRNGKPLRRKKMR